jgi:hypothetical protein
MLMLCKLQITGHLELLDGQGFIYPMVKLHDLPGKSS